jgi:hypothetical protein
MFSGYQSSAGVSLGVREYRHSAPKTIFLAGAELRGWKQIAGYLDVTERTAQLWERQGGLPIHRLPGCKGRAFSTRPELDSWKRARKASVPFQPARRAITVRLSEAHYERLKACSSARRLSIQELAAQALVQYLERIAPENAISRASAESRNSDLLENP